MNHYCRLCLKKDLHNLFFTFSNSLTDSFSVYECYNLLTSINLEHHDDKDNSKICRECWFKLLSLFQFRELALKNHNCVISMKALGFEALTDFLNKKNCASEDNILISEIKTEVYEIIENFKEEDLKGYNDKSNDTEIVENIQRIKNLKEPFFPVDCPECSLVFSTKKLLSKHRKEAHPVTIPKRKKYVSKITICSFCGKSYRLQSLYKHIRSKHRDLRFICDYCGKKYPHISSLKTHIYRHIKLRRFECDICQRKFTLSTSRNAHRKSHNANQPEVPLKLCPYPNCEYKSKMKTYVKQHVDRFHLKLIKFVCECGKGFSESSNYKEHRALHSDARNFECSLCQERFKTNIAMKIHQKRTHEQARYPCYICTKPYHNPSTLKNHIQTAHDRSRIYQCKYCDKNYASNRYLLDHVKEIHFKSKISCELCQKKLARVVNYKMHVKAKHKDIGEAKMTALLKRINTIRPDYENMQFYYS